MYAFGFRSREARARDPRALRPTHARALGPKSTGPACVQLQLSKLASHGHSCKERLPRREMEASRLTDSTGQKPRARPTHARALGSGTQEHWSCVCAAPAQQTRVPRPQLQGKIAPFVRWRRPPHTGSTGQKPRSWPSGILSVHVKPDSHRTSSWTSTASDRKSELQSSGEWQQVAGASQSCDWAGFWP